MRPDDLARFEAFGCGAVIAVTDPSSLTAAREAVEQTVDAFDRACSRFRDDSELSAVNAAAGTAVPVSPLLLDTVSEALRAARLSAGAVDPTVGGVLISLGYDRDFAAIAARDGGAPVTASLDGRAPLTASLEDRAPLTASLEDRAPLTGRHDSRIAGPSTLATVPGWRTIDLDREACTIRVGRGVTLDLGATGKALAADRAAADASAAARCGVLVSFGGDIALAGQAPPDGWLVRVTDDHRADLSAPGQWILLRSGGLATSSTTTRRWRTRSGSAHHLIDPRSGAPAAGAWRTATVAAASCLHANIASTTAIVRGEAAVPWIEQAGLPSRLVGIDGSVLHLAGWPIEGDDLGGSQGGSPASRGGPTASHGVAETALGRDEESAP